MGGFDVCAIADAADNMNGDGLDDLVVLRRTADGVRQSIVGFDGASGGLNAVAASRVASPATEILGTAIAASDLDGDGRRDIVLAGHVDPSTPQLWFLRNGELPATSVLLAREILFWKAYGSSLAR